MAKKCLFLLPLLCLCALSGFSLSSSGTKQNTLMPDFSISGGGRIFYNGMFDIWKYSNNYNNVGSTLEYRLYSNHGFGIGVFFDATYVEVGLDFIFGSFKPNARGYTGDFELASTQFGFSILGKLPLMAGPAVFFPLAGIDYQIFLSGEAKGLPINIKNRDDVKEYMGYEDIFDAFSLVLGIGLDFNLTSKLYLRGEALCNFKMESDSDKALKKLAKNNNVSFSLFTFGPRISIGVGYKFWGK
ncbi:MAG: hypothetical protein LBG90_02835 [Spirochaetaceae bacterium]|jgi:hypothetical protein|nr:hypothetical protein [Spirochaetaceae bacterium]